MKQSQINPEKFYSASEIIEAGYLGEIMKSIQTFTGYLMTERGKELFKPVIKEYEKANANRYFIRGSTLIEVLDLIEKEGINL